MRYIIFLIGVFSLAWVSVNLLLVEQVPPEIVDQKVDIRTRFIMRPNLSENVRGGLLTTNDLGFRPTSIGSEYSKSLGDSKEVWLFGGSVAFGYKSPDSSTIPFFMVEGNSKYKIVNFGQPGFTFLDEVSLLFSFLSTGDRPDAVIFLHGFNETYNLNDAFYRDEVSLVVDSAGGKNLRTAYDLLLKNYQMSPFDLNTWPFVRWFFSDRNFLSGLHGSKPKTLQDIDEFKKVSFGNWFGSFDEQDALMARRLDSFSAQVADVHSTNLNLVAALLNSLKIPFGIALQPSYAFEANKNRVGELQIDNIRGAKRLPFYLGTRFYYHRLYQRLIENGITAGVPIFSIANERLYSDMTDPCFIDYVHLTPDCNHKIALILNSFLEKTLVNGNPILDVGLGATPAVPEWYYEFALRRP